MKAMKAANAWLGPLAVFASLAFVAASSACGDDSAATGSGGRDGAGGAAPACFDQPQTHLEIINACTDAEAVDKQTVLPLLNADGSLPPLP